MNRYKGGITPLLSLRRAIAALLLCACAVVGYQAWNATQAVYATAPPHMLACGEAPRPLQAAQVPAGTLHASHETYFYEVTGDSPAAITANIARCAPAAPHAGEFAAYTTYRIRWQFDVRALQGGSCVPANASVSLVTQQVYPRLAGATTVAWQRFMQNLTTHEQRHAAFNREYAERVLHTLQAMPPASCQVAKDAANAAARAVVAELDAAQADYDTVTGHGRTQGAVLR